MLAFGARQVRATAKSESSTCGVFGCFLNIRFNPCDRALKPGYLMQASLAVVGGFFG
jgi:hypothetical protein